MRINLKKMKKILFAVISFIVVVLISVASNNRNSNIQDVALLLKNVEVLTAGEKGVLRDLAKKVSLVLCVPIVMEMGNLNLRLR